jgi:pimeloyl-ACP methyl ester carboxylesterase
VIPGAGHWVHAEAPGEFLRAVLEFTGKTASAE